METEPMGTEELNVEPGKKKSPMKWILAAALVLLLGAAAYVGGSLLNRQPAANIPQTQRMVGGGNGPSTQKGEGAQGIGLIPSDELPDRQPDTNGIFVKREDNSFFIGTGQEITLGIQINPDGEVESVSNYDGPVVEVVVNNETEILADVTELASNVNEGGSVQQEIAPGNVDEISENSMISVWGRKTGDRYIAETLVYTNPKFPDAMIK